MNKMIDRADVELIYYAVRTRFIYELPNDATGAVITALEGLKWLLRDNNNEFNGCPTLNREDFVPWLNIQKEK